MVWNSQHILAKVRKQQEAAQCAWAPEAWSGPRAAAEWGTGSEGAITAKATGIGAGGASCQRRQRHHRQASSSDAARPGRCSQAAAAGRPGHHVATQLPPLATATASPSCSSGSLLLQDCQWLQQPGAQYPALAGVLPGQNATASSKQTLIRPAAAAAPAVDISSLTASLPPSVLLQMSDHEDHGHDVHFER